MIKNNLLANTFSLNSHSYYRILTTNNYGSFSPSKSLALLSTINFFTINKSRHLLRKTTAYAFCTSP